MGGERGQATVEWVGILLLVALALAALGHFATKADGRSLGREVAHSVTRPLVRAAGGATAPAHRPGRPAFPIPSEPAVRSPSEPAFPIPPLIPRAGESVADLRIRLPRARTVMRRARGGAGLAWRRAWIACLVYERFRYALLHPESRFPGHTIPPSEVLRMVNDCISPLDLVRDWALVSGDR
jgi:hypothetical protein